MYFSVSETYQIWNQSMLLENQTHADLVKRKWKVSKILSCFRKQDWKPYIPGDLPITQLNETNFLVPVDKETVNHVKLHNNSLYWIEEPYPDIDFAEFRNDKVYIKVIFTKY